MENIESVKVYAKNELLYPTYGEYDDTKPNNIIEREVAPSEFISVRPIHPFLMMAQNYYIADIYWTSNTIENIISERFFKIQAVECIFFSIENDLIEVRTVINKYDKEIAKNIYAAECDLIEILRDYVFDFLIIYREEREINDICPSESIIIFRK